MNRRKWFGIVLFVLFIIFVLLLLYLFDRLGTRVIID